MRGGKMAVSVDNMIVGATFTLLGIVIGMIALVVTAAFAPRLVNMLTPRINEEKEMLRGNVAVARYFGGIVQSIILGIAIIIGASIIAGILG